MAPSEVFPDNMNYCEQQRTVGRSTPPPPGRISLGHILLVATRAKRIERSCLKPHGVVHLVRSTKTKCFINVIHVILKPIIIYFMTT